MPDSTLVQPRVFLSHAGADTAAARGFATLLRRNGIDVWFDQDNLQPGDRWMETLEQALEQASALVVYVGQLGVQHWVDREVRVGLELSTRNPHGFKIIPVLGEGAEVTRLPPFLRQHQGIPADDPHAIRRLVEALHGDGGPAVPAAYWATHSPFRSLHAFEPEDAWLFFGRDPEVGELLDRVARTRVQIVIGNSGSGKSSLVRAGLIPALQRGRLQVNGHAVERWRVATFRPGSDPFGELVDRLPGQLVPDLGPADRDALITRWRETFPAGANAVRNGIAALPRNNARTLLFADQFEELFTAVTDTDVQQRYIDALLKAADADGVHLIIGLRADFYAHCLQHPPLKPFLQRNYSVLLMQPGQLREAVEKRLALAGARAEAGLVEALLADVGTEPGNLALLEHTLAQLWEPATGAYVSPRLTNQRYIDIGRLKGAIGTHAQSVYRALTEEQQPLARQIFLELVQLGEEAPDTRRRVTKDRLIALARPELVQPLLEMLAAQRLVSTSGEPAEAETAFVEVSHEALIREWSDLRDWVKDNRDDLQFGRRLGAEGEDWASTRDPGTLLRGARLMKAKEWLAVHRGAPTSLRTFVEASDASEANAAAARLAQERQLRQAAEAREHAERALRAAEAAVQAARLEQERQLREAAESRERAERDRQRREADAQAARLQQEHQLREAAEGRERAERESRAQAQQRARVFRRFVWVMAALVALTAGAAAYAYRQQHVAESRQLAIEAQELHDRDPSRALNVAMSAWGRARTPEAHRAIAFVFPSSPNVLFHNFRVRGSALSPDWQRIVTVNEDYTARVWDARSGQTIAKLQGHTSVVRSAAFSLDGEHVVTASLDRTARVWDARSGQMLVTLQGHSGVVLSADFSRDGQRVVTASEDHTARVWDAQSGQMLVTLQGHPVAVYSAGFSADGQRVVTASEDGTARVWDARSGQALMTLKGHAGSVFAAAFSADGQRVVTASLDHTARVWDAQSGQMLATLQGHVDYVSRAVFSPDGQWVVTASGDHTARVWDAGSGQMLATLQHTNVVVGADFSFDGQRVFTASEDDQAVRLWNAHSGQMLVSLQHTDDLHAASFSPDGQMVVTASRDKTAQVWDARSGQALATLQGHTDLVWSASYSPDGQRVVTASSDGTARLWDARSGQALRTLEGHADLIFAAAFSPDGQRVVTACIDGNARLWDARSGQALRTLEGHGDSVFAAAFSPDGQWVVTASGDHTAQLWDARSGQAVTKLQGHTDTVWSASFSPDGHRVVTASWDKTARVWDMWSGQTLATFQGHSERVYSAAFSPDGQRVVTASADQTARIWDAHSGLAIATLEGHTGTVYSAAFSPDGRRVVTASSDGTARVFRVIALGDLAALFGK